MQGISTKITTNTLYPNQEVIQKDTSLKSSNDESIEINQPSLEESSKNIKDISEKILSNIDKDYLINSDSDHKELKISKDPVYDNKIDSSIIFDKKDGELKNVKREIKLIVLSSSNKNNLNFDINKDNQKKEFALIRNVLINDNSDQRLSNLQTGLNYLERMDNKQTSIINYMNSMLSDPKLQKKGRELIEEDLKNALIKAYQLNLSNQLKLQKVREEFSVYDIWTPDPEDPTNLDKRNYNSQPLNAAEVEFSNREDFQDRMKKQKAMDIDFRVKSSPVQVRIMINAFRAQKELELSASTPNSIHVETMVFIRNFLDAKKQGKLNFLILEQAKINYKSLNNLIKKYEKENITREEKKSIGTQIATTYYHTRKLITKEPVKSAFLTPQRRKVMINITNQVKSITMSL